MAADFVMKGGVIYPTEKGTAKPLWDQPVSKVPPRAQVLDLDGGGIRQGNAVFRQEPQGLPRSRQTPEGGAS